MVVKNKKGAHGSDRLAQAATAQGSFVVFKPHRGGGVRVFSYEDVGVGGGST